MPEKRERWSSRSAFIMAAVGSAIGLGNVWRFPFVAGQNGGGAFFIPYFVALLTAGIPLMIVEYGLGVKYQGSAAKSFRKWGKGWEWVGWWALMVGSIISFYYAVIMAWSWEYLWHSGKALFTGGGLPWAGRAGEFLGTEILEYPKGAPANEMSISSIVTPMVVGLALTWFVIWWIIHKGVGRVGKIVMITVPLPLVILVLLFFRGVTLEGAAAGLDFYLSPRWDQLWDPDVWLAAYGQIFFSLSLGFGILIAYASYLPKRSDITNNAFITSFANCATSFFAGLVVFSTIGFLATRPGAPTIEQMADGAGPTLAFVTYPTAIAQLGMAEWLLALVGILFFLMLLALGIDSAFSIVEGMVTGLNDKFRASRGTICALMCIVGFLAGLIFCTDTGSNYLDIVDHWMNNFGLAAVGLVECVAVGWFVKRQGGLRSVHPLRAYVNDVSDFRIGRWWELCVMVITPAILVWSLIMSFIGDFSEPYGPTDSGFPSWARLLLGWGVTAGVILMGFFFMSLKGGQEDEEEVAS